MKSLFLLDPDVIYLNHGSFGACPRPVFEAYQNWQRELERQPVEFITSRLTPLLEGARARLGAYLGVGRDDLVYVPNATFGVNILARSLPLGPGDEVLGTDHEYGACSNAWTYVCGKAGAVYRQQPIPVPFAGGDEIVEDFWNGVNDRTRVIFLSQVSSSTAIRFPVEEICRRARASGILTVLDGAHAPGQVILDLAALGVDFYTGNCHKWMLSPKGAGFLYARPEVQGMVEPLVVGWGWGPFSDYSAGPPFISEQQWLGTNDLSAYLSVPAAIDFMERHDWAAVRDRCHRMLADALMRVNELTGKASIYPNEDDFFIQMGVAELPRISDLKGMKKQLYEDFRIEVPLVEWNGRHFIRVSVQGYNTEEDLEALIKALEKLLPGYIA